MTPWQRQQNVHIAHRRTQRKFGTVAGNVNIGGAEVAGGEVWREAPDLAVANHALPVQPVVVIGVQNRDAICRQAGEDFAFGFSHARERTETFEMRRRQVVDQRGIRACQADGPGDFALMIGTKLNHRVLMFRRETQQRHRHADVIIQVACGVERVAALAENGSGHLFHRGFTGRPRQRDHARGHLLSDPRRQFAKRQARVSHHQLRQVNIQLAAYQQRASAASLRLVGKIMRVETLAFQRHKQAAGRQFAGVGRYRVDISIGAMQLAFQNVGKLAQKYVNHATAPSRRAAVTRSE
ncbi:hypothetical protein BN132_3442 [Cronobacter turicensis 564]|nr:hypothetical protein BN132_3442 [Cronobacter turicensis 564]